MSGAVAAEEPDQGSRTNQREWIVPSAKLHSRSVADVGYVLPLLCLSGTLFARNIEKCVSVRWFLNAPMLPLRRELLVWSQPLSVKKYEEQVRSDLLRNFLLTFFITG